MCHMYNYMYIGLDPRIGHRRIPVCFFGGKLAASRRYMVSSGAPIASTIPPSVEALRTHDCQRQCLDWRFCPPFK